MQNIKQNPFFFVVFGIVLYLAFILLQPYFAPIILAFLTTVIFKRVYIFFYDKRKNKNLSSLLSTIVVILFIFIPTLVVGYLSFKQIQVINSDVQELTANSVEDLDIDFIVNGANDVLASFPGIEYEINVEDLSSQVLDLLRSSASIVSNSIVSIGTSSVNIVTQFVLYLLLVFFMFPLQHSFNDKVAKASPLDDKLDRLYLNRVTSMSVAMIKGTFVIAFIQATFSGALLWMAGVDYVLFWVIIMIFLAIIPIVGTTLVIVPIGVVLILTGSLGWGIFLIVTNLLITSNIDNVLRPMLVPKEAEMSPMLVLLGVLGGIKLFGPLGFLYGPVIMILLVTSFEIYLKHFKENEDRVPVK